MLPELRPDARCEPGINLGQWHFDRFGLHQVDQVSLFLLLLLLAVLLVLLRDLGLFPRIREEILDSGEGELGRRGCLRLCMRIHQDHGRELLPVQNYVLVRSYFEMQVQVHYVKNQAQLVVVNLEFQEVERHPRDFNVELV